MRAILFYSPNCGHCQYVIGEVLPPLFERYGEQLQMVGVDVMNEAGASLYMAAVGWFQLDQTGVPFLVVGDDYLFGSVDIPEKFPGLIDSYLSQGGVDWPAIPGLVEALDLTGGSAQQPVSANDQSAPGPGIDESESASAVLDPNPENTLEESQYISLLERFNQDPSGNSVSVLVLIGMVVSLAWVGLRGRQISTRITVDRWDRLIPLVCAAGLAVAGYLAYVETAQVEAVCGPLGDCNTVQQSVYARLFGVLPIGIFGALGYLGIMLAWALGRMRLNPLSNYAKLSLFGMAAIGTMFSIYLTFLEPFVIGATCAWCLTSAVLITALLWLSAPAGLEAYSDLRN